MNAFVLPVMLQCIGFLVILAEIFIPSMGILSVIALGLLSYSLYLVYTGIAVSAFWGFLVGDLLMMPPLLILGFKLLSRSSLTLKKSLAAGDGVTSQSPELAAFLDKTGKTLSILRPSGTALIDGRRLDVVADGDFIELGVPIQVCRVTGNQVVVRRITA